MGKYRQGEPIEGSDEKTLFFYLVKELLRELLTKKENFLKKFFQEVSVEKLEEALKLLLNCQGMVIVTGVGKSGLVGKKIAQTMTSTGTRAFFLSTQDALHGDIGIVKEGDLFIILSKSGETEEILNLLPYLRSRNVTIIAMISKEGSTLAKAADCAITLPMERELCPFDMAPTTSTTLQTIVGDILTVALMREKKISLDQYAMSHPAGQIGKKATVKVADLMLTGDKVPTCRKEMRVIETLVELSNKRCGCLLVLSEDQALEGIFTDGDLRRSIELHGSLALEKTVEELMTKQPKTIPCKTLASEAIRIMEADQKNAITVLPVVNEKNKVDGLIKLHDIVQTGI